MKKMTIKKVEELLSSSKIGDVVKCEKEIENLKIEDFSFDDKKLYSLFKDTVESDKEFNVIIKNIGGFLDSERCLDYSDQGKMKKLKEETEKLSMLERYIILTYFGAEFGIKFPKELRDENNPEWYIQPIKEGKIRFPYRINYWDQATKSKRDYVNNLVRAFSLGEKFTYWDEETALKHPLKNYWMELSSSLPGVVAHYLRGKGSINTDNKALVEKLREKLEIDKELVSAKNTSGFSNEKLNKVLGVKNTFEEYDRVKDKIELLQNGLKAGKEYLTKNNKVIFFENYSGASDDRGWDVRISRSIIRILGPDFIQSKALDPYFRFEDFLGGGTYRHEENRIAQIQGVQETKENYTISFLDGNQKEKNITIKKEEQDIISPKEAKKIIESVIKKFGDEWLSSGNKEPIAMQIKKYGKSERKGNYPYFVAHKLMDDMAYMAAMKVIDAERYEELLIDGREQGIVIDPQIHTNLYRVDLCTEKCELVGSRTTSRMETIGILLTANEYDGKIEFNTKPEILFSGKKVNVNLKVRKGGDVWTNLILY
jgi:hypothetical protein